MSIPFSFNITFIIKRHVGCFLLTRWPLVTLTFNYFPLSLNLNFNPRLCCQRWMCYFKTSIENNLVFNSSTCCGIYIVSTWCGIYVMDVWCFMMMKRKALLYFVWCVIAYILVVMFVIYNIYFIFLIFFIFIRKYLQLYLL